MFTVGFCTLLSNIVLCLSHEDINLLITFDLRIPTALSIIDVNFRPVTLSYVHDTFACPALLSIPLKDPSFLDCLLIVSMLQPLKLQQFAKSNATLHVSPM